MSKDVGIWIDHRRAVIVTLNSNGEQTEVVVSGVEKHLERSGDSPLKGSYEAQQVPADDSRQRALTGELAVYYDAVIVALRDCGRVLVFGPGEAKGELNKRLLKKKPGTLVEIQTEDKMTDRQVAAKVRDYFRSKPT